MPQGVKFTTEEARIAARRKSSVDYRRRHPDRNIASRKKYRDKHREEIVAKKREARYGLTSDEYYRIWNEQFGLCAICQDKPAKHIDHSHVTGKVRGLLCGPCNMGLGLCQESVARLKAAIRYLEKHHGR